MFLFKTLCATLNSKIPIIQKRKLGHRGLNKLSRSLVGGIPRVFPDDCPSAVPKGVKEVPSTHYVLHLPPSSCAEPRGWRSYRRPRRMRVKDGLRCVVLGPHHKRGHLPLQVACGGGATTRAGEDSSEGYIVLTCPRSARRFTQSPVPQA